MRQWQDLAYAATSPTQRLDIYLPPEGDGPFPVVMWIHGGGWLAGSKDLEPRAFQRTVLTHGYALVSVGYRLSREAKFPAQIQDLKAAVRWLRSHADAYALKADSIGAWGSSAGGHLAALLGTSGEVAALAGAELGNPGVSSRVQAVVDWYGPTDFLQMDEQTLAIGCPLFEGIGHRAPNSPESRLLGYPIGDRPDLVQAANPITYIRPDVPPFFIQHGSADCTVPYPQSLLLYDALRAVAGSDRARFSLIMDAGHGGRVFHSSPNLAQVIQFFDQHLQSR